MGSNTCSPRCASSGETHRVWGRANNKSSRNVRDNVHSMRSEHILVIIADRGYGLVLSCPVVANAVSTLAMAADGRTSSGKGEGFRQPSGTPQPFAHTATDGDEFFLAPLRPQLHLSLSRVHSSASSHHGHGGKRILFSSLLRS